MSLTLFDRVNAEISAGRLSSDFVDRLQTISERLPHDSISRIEAILSGNSPENVKTVLYSSLSSQSALFLAPDPIHLTLRRPVTVAKFENVCMRCFLSISWPLAVSLDACLDEPSCPDAVERLNPRLSLALVDRPSMLSKEPPIYEVIGRALASTDSLTDFLETTSFLNNSPNWRYGQLTPESVHRLASLPDQGGRVHKFLAELGRLLGGRSEDSVLWQMIWRLRGWHGLPVIRNNILYDIPRPWTQESVSTWFRERTHGLRECPTHQPRIADEGEQLKSEEALELVVTKFVDARNLYSPYELLVINSFPCCVCEYYSG
jgi:hypothetical protein